MERLVFKGFKRDFSATFPFKPHHILSVYPLRRIYPCIAKGFSPKDSKIALGKATDIVTVSISMGTYFGELL